MSFRRLVVWLSFLAVFTMAVRVSVDTDTWWHLRAGEWMVDNGQILRMDPFSLTRQGEPWIYPGWLAQITLYSVYRIFGFAGLNLFTALMVVLTFVFVWPQLEAPPLMRAFVLVLAAAVSGVYWSARPHLFSFVLSGIFLWVLYIVKKGKKRWVWVLPPLMALWSNLHGGFAVGFIFLFASLFGEMMEAIVDVGLKRTTFIKVWQDRRNAIMIYVVIGLLCALAVAVNPHGPQMLLYPFKTVSVGVLRDFIQEWQSPDFHHLEVHPFIWMLILSTLALAMSQEKKTAYELILLLGFVYMSLTAARNIALFALVAAPILTRHGYKSIQPLLEQIGVGGQFPNRTVRILNFIIIVILAIASLAKISIPLDNETNREAIDAQVPVNAVEFLNQYTSPGPLFNSYNWGGYILWALYPKYLSFVDGRTDLFSDEILEHYLFAWLAEPGWEEVLDRWDIELALLEPSAPLSMSLQRTGWKVLYKDESAIVMARDLLP